MFSKSDLKPNQHKFDNETEKLTLNELKETDIKIISKLPKTNYDSNSLFVHESGMSFSDLFKKECDQKSILEVFDAVQYLLKASQGDLNKIRRFYVTVIVLAIHSSSLNPKIKASLRKYFQLTDETEWRDNPLLKLCEDYNSVLNNPYAKSEISIKVDKARLRSIITLKSYLIQAIKAQIPSLEPWDVDEYMHQASKISELLKNPKGTFLYGTNS